MDVVRDGLCVGRGAGSTAVDAVVDVRELVRYTVCLNGC